VVSKTIGQQRDSSPIVLTSSLDPDIIRTFRRVSLAGALVSSLGIASLRPRTRSGGVRGFDLKKFMLGARMEIQWRERRRGFEE
jgi:hypothetical protein